MQQQNAQIYTHRQTHTQKDGHYHSNNNKPGTVTKSKNPIQSNNAGTGNNQAQHSGKESLQRCSLSRPADYR